MVKFEGACTLSDPRNNINQMSAVTAINSIMGRGMKGVGVPSDGVKGSTLY